MKKHYFLIYTLIVTLLSITSCNEESNNGPCAQYPDQQTSEYILPYESGECFIVDQGNCSDGSHSADSNTAFAYDFLMPIGTPIIAAREGIVFLKQESYEDGTRISGEENYINIRHDDGSIASYVHLTKDGALVEVGDTILQGQLIGYSGDSGSSTAPHLHFHVQGCNGCKTIPITFKNTRAHPNGLQYGECYTAE